MQDLRKDLTSEDDIKLLVDTFYDKVNKDDLLSPIFNDFAKVNWEAHLPKMYAFWSKILFAKGDYKGNPFEKHIPLPVSSEHFERWIFLFFETMDELFEGTNADSSKIQAQSIAHVFQSKLAFMNQKTV